MTIPNGNGGGGNDPSRHQLLQQHHDPPAAIEDTDDRMVVEGPSDRTLHLWREVAHALDENSSGTFFRMDFYVFVDVRQNDRMTFPSNYGVIRIEYAFFFISNGVGKLICFVCFFLTHTYPITIQSFGKTQSTL